jgi:hypothetical protein
MLMRLIYFFMLGEDVEFGFVVVCSLTIVRKNAVDKRLGYLCAALFLHSAHPMTTLLLASFQRDLQSSNDYEVS